MIEEREGEAFGGPQNGRRRVPAGKNADALAPTQCHLLWCGAALDNKEWRIAAVVVVVVFVVRGHLI